MPKTLLLADDSVVIQKLVGLSFANEDVQLVTTDNGDDALARAAEQRPDLVLADVVMPGKNGYEVCEAIKADPQMAGTPVLLLTGTFEAFDEARARSAGADGHITKPFEAQVLVERVNELLARTQEAAPPASPAPAPAAPATPADEDSYDFFDSNVDNLSGDTSETAEVATPAAAPSPSSPPPAAPPTPMASPAPPAQPPAQAQPPTPAQAAPQPPVHAQPAPPAPAAPTMSPEDSFSFDDELVSAASDRDGDPLESLSPSSVDADDLGADDDLDLGLGDEELGGDRTVALMPDGAIPVSDPASSTDPFAGMDAPGETILAAEPLEAAAPPATPRREGPGAPAAGATTGSDLSFGEAPARAPLQDATVLADDLFETSDGGPMRPPIPDPSISFDFPDDPPTAASGRSPAPDPAADYDVSTSDLRDPLPQPPPAAPEARIELASPGSHGVPASHAARPEPGPDPLSAPFAPVELEEEEERSTVVEMEPPVADPSDTTEPDPFETPALAREPAPAPRAPASGSAAPDLTPMMRERIHETLEKVAWEAFSDVSDTVVKEVLARVEAIAWEVIPKMAETLIQEEIRRMKDGGEE